MAEFTAEDILLLEQEAEKAKADRIHQGSRAETYAENRFAFAREVFFGSYFHTERTRAWVERIKREIARLRAERGNGRNAL